MLNYVRQFFKIRVVFNTFYLWSKVGDPQFFFCISGKSNSLSDRSKNLKKIIYRLENFRANVLKFVYLRVSLCCYVSSTLEGEKRHALSAIHEACTVLGRPVLPCWSTMFEFRGFYLADSNSDYIWQCVWNSDSDSDSDSDSVWNTNGCCE